MSDQREADIALVCSLSDDTDWLTGEELEELAEMYLYLERAIELTPEMRARVEELDKLADQRFEESE